MHPDHHAIDTMHQRVMLLMAHNPSFKHLLASVFEPGDLGEHSVPPEVAGEHVPTLPGGQPLPPDAIGDQEGLTDQIDLMYPGGVRGRAIRNNQPINIMDLINAMPHPLHPPNAHPHHHVALPVVTPRKRR